jgi:hypothetical protein
LILDAPIYYNLDRNLSVSSVYRVSGAFVRTQIGVENLRVEIIPRGNAPDQHAVNAIDLIGIEDGWVRDCVVTGFQLSGVRTAGAYRVSVIDNEALDPVQNVESPWMYNFNAYLGSQLVLFSGNHASNGRHHYIVNGSSNSSGIVFLRNTSSGAHAPSEGHRLFPQAILYDMHLELDGPRPGMAPILMGLYNRGDYGTGHGWSAVNSTVWNSDLAEGYLVVQQAPGGQNFSIGNQGRRITGFGPFDQPGGYIEGSGRPGIIPESLYEAQLRERTRTEE